MSVDMKEVFIEGGVLFVLVDNLIGMTWSTEVARLEIVMRLLADDVDGLHVLEERRRVHIPQISFGVTYLGS